MNRSILIVICDFLLVSLLAFSTVDINQLGEAGSPPNQTMEVVNTNASLAEAGRDLAAVMRQALDEERRSRDLLMGELNKARETLTQQQNLLKEREQQVQVVQAGLEAKEREAQRLAADQAALIGQVAVAQTNIAALSSRLQDTSIEAVISKERLAAMEAELKKQVDQASQLQNQLSTLQQSNQVVLTEKQELATQLKVAEVERKHAAQMVEQTKEQVQIERQERAKLAEGVKALASKSQELTEEIRDNRPLTPNTIFFDVLTNRVQARITALRSGAFGIDASKRKLAETVIVSDGTNSFALSHVEETPLDLWTPGTDWEGLTGSLAGTGGQVPIRALSFYRRDPRLVLIPVSAAEITKLGVKTYRTSPEPYKFQDAVLVGTREAYYGECRFQIDVTTPDYVKLDNNFIKGLFGKFNPSRGDLVFSKSGDLLGIMVNGSYCLLLQQFNTAATMSFSPDVRSQRTGRTLAQLHSIVLSMPSKLQ